MPTRYASALFLSLALVTTACSSSMKKPIEKNPSPKQQYEITITVQGAPKDFDSAGGFMQYEIENNDKCVPKNYMSGVPDNLAQFPPIRFSQVGNHIYKGKVVADYYIDADYYGMGICHWKMTAIVAELKISGNGVSISPSLGADEITAQKSSQFYFPLVDLSSGSSPSYGDAGARTLEAAKKFPSGYFTITMSAKRMVL